MLRITYVLLLLTILATTWSSLLAQQPHIPRQGKNLIPNSAVQDTLKRTMVRGATLDRGNSRTHDGSGSIKLVNPPPNSSSSVSSLIAVEPGKTYTYGFYFKIENGPSYVGGQISLHDKNGKYIRNLTSSLGATSSDGVWQEYALPFTVPAGVSFVKCEVYKADNTQPKGIVWADEFYLGEGLGLDQPPSPNRRFEGEHVRIDQLGNFEIKRRGVWTPFFPLCMYSDNRRDWAIYSQQGWNTITWAGAPHQIRQAKEAVSKFNPDGMLAGFQISQYTSPKGWAYNDLDNLRNKLTEIFNERLDDNLLFYYWDNENHHDQWQVACTVINAIKSYDVDRYKRRLHPIYALQGTFNNARLHSATGLVDVSGTYFNGNADAPGDEPAGHEGLFILDRHHGQTSPAAIAQFNGVNGAGDMRMRLYNSIIFGARGMGYWRDYYQSKDEKFQKTVGPVDEKLWWPDFPNLRREIDALMPLIRQPHWTAWTARLNVSEAKDSKQVRIGIRDLNGIAHLIVVNQTSRPQSISITTDGLAYDAREVQDCLNGQSFGAVRGSTFSLTVPPIGVGSGTIVLRLVP